MRVKKAKPGQLIMHWGVAERGDNPDVCFAWGGEGANKRDGSYLHWVFASERCLPDYSEGARFPYKWEQSAVKELEARGYDITTLKFSIQKKKPAVSANEASNEE